MTDAELEQRICSIIVKGMTDPVLPFTSAQAVLAAIRASGRLAPEVGADVLKSARSAASAALVEKGHGRLTLDVSETVIRAAAPLIAAAAEAKARDVLEGVLVDVDFAIRDHTDGQATLAACRTRLGIIRDHLLAAIRTGAAP